MFFSKKEVKPERKFEFCLTKVDDITASEKKIDGHYIIRFLDNTGKELSFRKEYVQRRDFLEASISGRYFDFYGNNVVELNRRGEIVKVYPEKVCDELVWDRPNLFVPHEPSVTIDGTLIVVGKYISCTFVKETEEDVEFKLNRYKIDYREV